MPERLSDVVIDSLLIEAEGNFTWTHSDAQMVRLLTQALRQVREDRDAAREQVRALREALPDPDKLLSLSAFLDVDDAEHGRRGEEVQYDLHTWADAARAALAASEALGVEVVS